MARYNPEIMTVDEGQEKLERVFGPKNDTSKITEEDIYKASRDAGIELGVDPVTLAYEAGLAGDRSKPLNKMTDEERAAKAVLQNSLKLVSLEHQIILNHMKHLLVLNGIYMVGNGAFTIKVTKLAMLKDITRL